ncbi:acyltransferase family protein [Allosphingosinicella deserti]|uniref:Acyltransferase 3 domain-containing protein n=1 Tax=Allosphingosinicella deserti TaxID=2116704 RepID=A0A2P7QS89_9SPHN|nr:acyltransferase [Sphingomonas deserti]PSJ40817.1 hypothetical protein C7I55_11040 [Sphingomonas deserti]
MSIVEKRHSDHLLTLDALRGIAALAVVLTHIGAIANRPQVGAYGYLAVDLFFIMSGFVIGRAYEPRILAGMSWRAFMTLRIVRLYPVLALGCLAAVLAAPSPTWPAFAQFLLIPDFSTPALFPLNEVLWSLFFEIVINGAHAACARKLTTSKLVIAVALAGLAFLAATWIHSGPGVGWGRDSFFGGFARVAWGYGIGLLIYRLTSSNTLVLPAWPAAFPVFVLGIFLLAPNSGFGALRVLFAVFLLFPVMAALSTNAVVPKSLAGLAAWLGAVSYPLYAVHYPILKLAASWQPGSLGWGGTIVVILLVSTVIEYGIDAPLRRRLRRRRPARNGAAAPAAG